MTVGMERGSEGAVAELAAELQLHLTWFEFAAAPSERLSQCNINSPSCSI